MGCDWGFRSVSDHQHTANPMTPPAYHCLLLLACFLQSSTVLLTHFRPLLFFCRVVASAQRHSTSYSPTPQGQGERDKKPQSPTAGGSIFLLPGVNRCVFRYLNLWKIRNTVRNLSIYCTVQVHTVGSSLLVLASPQLGAALETQKHLLSVSCELEATAPCLAARGSGWTGFKYLTEPDRPTEGNMMQFPVQSSAVSLKAKAQQCSDAGLCSVGVVIFLAIC